jgi:hypothetical protein
MFIFHQTYKRINVIVYDHHLNVNLTLFHKKATPQGRQLNPCYEIILLKTILEALLQSTKLKQARFKRNT